MQTANCQTPNLPQQADIKEAADESAKDERKVIEILVSDCDSDWPDDTGEESGDRQQRRAKLKVKRRKLAPTSRVERPVEELLPLSPVEANLNQGDEKRADEPPFTYITFKKAKWPKDCELKLPPSDGSGGRGEDWTRSGKPIWPGGDSGGAKLPPKLQETIKKLPF